MSDSVRPHRWQPTRLPRPWDSPGKNTGVGCHFLLQCVKVKLLSRVRLLVTPWTAAYQAPPSMGFSRQEYWSRVPLPSPHRLYSPWNSPGQDNWVWVVFPFSRGSSQRIVTINQYGSALRGMSNQIKNINEVKWRSESPSVMSDSLQPHGLYSPWNSLGQNTGVSLIIVKQKNQIELWC